MHAYMPVGAWLYLPHDLHTSKLGAINDVINFINQLIVLSISHSVQHLIVALLKLLFNFKVSMVFSRVTLWIYFRKYLLTCNS